MALKLLLGFTPFLALAVLCLLFYKVDEKIRAIDMACVRLGLFVLAIGIWVAVVTLIIRVNAGSWPKATVVAEVSFVLATLAFLEPLIRTQLPRPHLRLS